MGGETKKNRNVRFGKNAYSRFEKIHIISVHKSLMRRFLAKFKIFRKTVQENIIKTGELKRFC